MLSFCCCFWNWNIIALKCYVSFCCTTSWISHMYTYIRRRQWHPTPVLLPGTSHGQRSLVGCSPWGLEESDTERLHFHFSLSYIGEGNSNPLQCSCLENPRDGVAWWAAVYGVAQSRTRVKRLSSSSRHISPLSWPLPPFHPSRSSKSTKLNSLGYTAAIFYINILDIFEFYHLYCEFFDLKSQIT